MRLHLLIGAFLLSVAPPALAQADPDSTHRRAWPQIATGETPSELSASVAEGPQLERGRSAKWLLDQRRKLSRALDAVLPQRKGVVDAYVVSVALDSDPVFGREAREAGRVLTRRYDAAGRSLTLAGGAEPNGSLEGLTLALARVAEVMDKSEDVLVLYSTSHGTQMGIAYHDGDQGYGLLSPARLAGILDELGITNRMLLLSACYSGIFVSPLASETSAILTAASSDRTSFGCRAANDWTFFGDAVINHALRKAQPFDAASIEARDMISGWEMRNALPPSNPQLSIGDGVARWLTPLEARMPKAATAPVGAPATDALKP